MKPILAALGTIATLAAQAGLRAQSTAQRPAFDVVSVKPSERPGNEWRNSPGRYIVDGITASNLLRNAYDLNEEEVVNGPAWLGVDHFLVSATFTGEATTERESAMLQALLADRFALKAHRETRELPKYRAVLDRKDGAPGPALQPSAGCSHPHPPDSPCSVSIGMAELRMQEVTIPYLLKSLESFARRRIEDATGLIGKYDLTLRWSRSPDDLQYPSIFTAIKEQLGLKLESTRGPVNVLVIDHIDHPTPD